MTGFIDWEENHRRFLRVAVILDDDYFLHNGVQQVVRSLCEEWHRGGHDVTVICGGSGERRWPEAFAVETVSELISLPINGNRVTVPIKVDRDRIRAFIRANDFDVIHVQAPFGPIGSVAVNAASPSTRVVASFHIATRGIWERLGLRLIRVRYRRAMSRIDAFTADSPASAAIAYRCWGVETKVIPNGIIVDPIETTDDTEDDRFRIAFVGRLVERKGCLDAVRAIGLLGDDLRARICLSIVGAGPLDLELRAECARLGVSAKHHGEVDEARKFEILAKSNLGVFPALGGESFGIVLLEAMRAGLPYLAYRNDGYSFVSGESNPGLIAVAAVGELSATIKTFFTDESFAGELRKFQRDRLAIFDISEIAKTYLTEFVA